jgi:hypothetical protein
MQLTEDKKQKYIGLGKGKKSQSVKLDLPVFRLARTIRNYQQRF